MPPKGEPRSRIGRRRSGRAEIAPDGLKVYTLWARRDQEIRGLTRGRVFGGHRFWGGLLGTLVFGAGSLQIRV